MEVEETLTFPIRIRLCFCYTFLFLFLSSCHRYGYGYGLRALDLNTLSRFAIANPIRFGRTAADVHVFLLLFFFPLPYPPRPPNPIVYL